VNVPVGHGDGNGFDAGGNPFHTRAGVNDLKHKLAMERRLERRERRREEYRRGLRPMAIAAWNISKEHNVGSLVRTAHATAASEVILVGEREWNIEAARTAELYTTVTQVADIDAFRIHLNSRRWNLVAVELDSRAVNLFDAEYPDRPCFLLGAELGGVPDELLNASELVVQIPQWGLVPSLNLAIAGSIVLYDFLAKLHREARLDRPHGGLVDESSGQPEGEDDADHRG
jgi:tRNA G18 (ribose-2'-O)-methylase SpoU